MFLRRLVIRGFKSFADRTVFDFTPGVAVIVGPNGSGKSNIVDAIAWVLGEQGAKSLRGGKMEDVIFAGTPNRPALGRAEVSLTIDNSSGVLPIEFTEVTLRRTLFRSGESEYAINDAPCRLLDIQELLSDSGIGRELHTIVSQGQLEDVLAGRPEDRRAVIEEAAGLLKHRKRKERAVRKLDRVDADIERLGDIIGELRRQIRPLERQAEVAQRAEEIKAELDDLRLKAWILEYRSVQDEEDAEAEARAQADVEREAARLLELTARAEKLESDLADASRSTEQLLGTEYRLSALRDRFDALAGLADERRKHLDDLAMREPRGEAPSTADIDEAERALAEARAAKEAAEAEARAAASERAQMQGARDEAVRAREEVVHLHGERAALRAAVEQAAEEQRRIAEQRASAAARTAELAAGIEEIRGELARLEQEEDALSARTDDAEARRDAGARVVERMVEREREAERLAEGIRARLAALDEEIERAADPAALLADLAGIEGRVLDHVRARPGFERALHAALGSLAGAVLAGSTMDALRGLERLKRDGARGAIAVPGGRGSVPLPAGVRGVASVLEDIGPKAAEARALLAGVALADGAAEAAALAEEHAGLVVVTLDGDRFDGAEVSGGAPLQARDLHAERRALQAQLEEATDAQASLARDLAHVRAELEVLDAEVATLAGELNELDAATEGAAQRLEQLERDRHATEREDSVLAGRLVEVDERLAEDGERLKAVEAHLGRVVAVEPTVDEATLAEAERRAAERSLRLGEATERERAAAVTLESLRERARRIGEDRARWEAGRSGWQVGARRAGEVAAAARATVERVSAWVEHARAARTDGETMRATLQQDLERTRAERRGCETSLDEARRFAHEADLRRAERSHRLASLVQRLHDELRMTPDQAIEAVSVDGLDPDELRRRITTLDRRLGLLGRVNPIAMEQFQELKDRHAFLTEQVDDLRKSRRDLLAVVEEVDQKIVEIFGAAFADIAAEFQHVFHRLFPGGEGRLSLTDPDDLLTTGIEVEARPAGKRVKRVSLLSGGERSLVSVALLFSVFRARPSPFYLLDEVEPALDDVNLHRFLEIAAEFKEQSQLLIVTHQKRTMEIAEVLYGISMGSEGVSKVICERMDAVAPAAGRTIDMAALDGPAVDVAAVEARAPVPADGGPDADVAGDGDAVIELP